MFIDHDDELARSNPGVMHALAILLDCHDDVLEARSLAALQWESGAQDPKHWRQVWAVLNGEGPRA